MHVIAWASRKGGVGKSACCVNAAAALAENGERVLVVDLDSQANGTAWLGQKETRGLAEAFVDGRPIEAAVVRTDYGVDLIPSSGLFLQKCEKLLAGEPGAELIFRKALAKLPHRWDFVFLDTPPAAGLMTISALVAAAEAVIPVEASAVSLKGIAGILQAVKPIRERLNSELRYRVVMARLDRTRIGAEICESLEKKFGERFLPVRIRDRVTVRESWGHQQPVTAYDPQGDAASDYRDLASALQATRERGAIHASIAST